MTIYNIVNAKALQRSSKHESTPPAVVGTIWSWKEIITHNLSHQIQSVRRKLIVIFDEYSQLKDDYIDMLVPFQSFWIEQHSQIPTVNDIIQVETAKIVSIHSV